MYSISIQRYNYSIIYNTIVFSFSLKIDIYKRFSANGIFEMITNAISKSFLIKNLTIRIWNLFDPSNFSKRKIFFCFALNLLLTLNNVANYLQLHIWNAVQFERDIKRINKQKYKENSVRFSCLVYYRYLDKIFLQ